MINFGHFITFFLCSIFAKKRVKIKETIKNFFDFRNYNN
ncbi:hypothetical protein HMPREF1109_1710 [Streptococcus intermedius SK54 = ATCC 27335]|nr:hypothetical protein HMPREF1109_1710 [Streptococcus intermedius SK54 = ATCC 27335]